MKATPTSRHEPHPIAVLLNANAKQVSPRIRDALSSLVPAGSVFLSRDPAEAHRIADTVISRGVGTVFTGGGDGTFVSWVNHILDRVERQDAKAPRFGVLALGTGNAMAGLVGAGRPVEDLRRYMNGDVASSRRVDLVTVEGRRTPFAGLGVDAAVLEDYNWLKRRLGRRVASGVKGYGLAIALRSAPRQVLQRPVYCEIVNTGGPAWRVGADGEPVGRPIQRGDLLYAGRCMLAAGGTVPYYGFGLRAFPFAGRRPGTMQLRVATRIPISALLANVGRIFAGEFSHPGLLDFLVDRVSMSFDRPLPLQVGGDAEGPRDRVEMGIAPRPVEVLDFRTLARPAAA
jgi:diacylglycerol kinase family enzyme